MTRPPTNEQTPEGLARTLCHAGIFDDPSPSIEPAGDGNINWVRRLRSRRSGQAVIVKHARPALEKFPEYTTSTERIVFENRYFELARAVDDASVCPQILYFDEQKRILVLEDLGDAERLDVALLRSADVGPALLAIARFLGRLHRATLGDPTLVIRFANGDIQRLHGDHIFALPYRNDGFPVPPGVEARAHAVRKNGEISAIAARAYSRYLEPQGALVHADVQPGNILLQAAGPVLLDAEIAHVGDPAFDVGTLLAHLWLARIATQPADDPIRQTTRIWESYLAEAGSEAPYFASVARYAGLEMMRRTIGAARVSAVETAEASLEAIDAAERLILAPPETATELSIP